MAKVGEASVLHSSVYTRSHPPTHPPSIHPPSIQTRQPLPLASATFGPRTASRPDGFRLERTPRPPHLSGQGLRWEA